MLDCDAQNTGSEKVIMKCGGMLEKEEIAHYHGEEICNRIFWIRLAKRQ